MSQPVPKELQVFRNAREEGKQRALDVKREDAISVKMEELRKASHPGATDDKLRRGAILALGL